MRTKSLWATVGTLLLFGIPTLANAEPTPCLQWKSLTFVRIPSGQFWMGANLVSGKATGFKDELPRTQVAIKSFCLLQNYLSEDQTNELIKTLRLQVKDDDFDGPNEMTWAKAGDLAKALGRLLNRKIRLPTEAEWEYAARGGLENKPFPWGDMSDSFGNVSVTDIVLKTRQDCKLASIESEIKEGALRKCIPKKLSAEEQDAPLSQFMCIAKMLNNHLPDAIPNKYGLVNLVNNAWEWTSSKYMPYPYKADDGREDPIRGRLKTEYRVLRGGGNETTETCKGYTSLRGFGSVGKEYQAHYKVRFVLED